MVGGFILTIAAVAAHAPQGATYAPPGQQSAAPRAVSASTQQPVVKSGVDAWERGDFARAVQLWRDPALAGDADAQFNLAQAYKFGRGVSVDLKQAEDWYARAARQGHVQAADNYGLLLYQNGKRAEAMPWLKAASERADPRADYVYGTELFNGELAPKDWVRAYALMTRASGAGIPRASESLAQMDRYIPASDRQRGTALSRSLPRAGTAMLASAPPAPRPVAASPAPAARPVAPASRPIAAVPRPAPPKPAPAARPTGAWRVQLGAFGAEASARTLWTRLSGRVGALGGLQPDYARAGNVTRLQARGIASASEAARVCAAVKAAGNPCLPVRP